MSCCTDCGRTFPHDVALQAHRSSSATPLICPVCSLRFCTPTRFKKHKHLPCPACAATFATQIDLDRHLSAKLHWECGHCGVGFPSKSRLNKHEKDMVHVAEAVGAVTAMAVVGGEGGFGCGVCGRRFKSGEALVQHIGDSKKQHEKIRGVARGAAAGFGCDVCGRGGFRDEEALAQHVRDSKTQHEKIGVMRAAGLDCDVCGRGGFKNEQALAQHVRDSKKQHKKIKREEQKQDQERQGQQQLEEAEKNEMKTATTGIATTATTATTTTTTTRTTTTTTTLTTTKEVKKLKKKAKKSKVCSFECEMCFKKFELLEDWDRHMRSLAHHPLSDLPCIAGLYDEAKSASGAGCTARFTSPSAMLFHLESGSCSSGFDRGTLNAMIAERDIDCIIRERVAILLDDDDDENDDDDDIASALDELRLDDEDVASALDRLRLDDHHDALRALDHELRLDDHDIIPALDQLRLDSRPVTPGGSETTDSGGVILTPGSEVSVPSSPFHHHLPPVPSMRCPLCPGKKREFPSMKALGQHMGSAAHTATEKIYHCPVSLLAESLPGSGIRIKRLARKLKRERGKGFSTASGLAQHLESGACVGGEEALRVAMSYVEERLRQGDLPVTVSMLV